MLDNYISVPLIINKSNSNTLDQDGNYIFEVEASNENLDLQNQIIQQKALLESKDYFLSNGVISDDHQHRTVDDEGNVVSNKDMIIGEPISIRTDGKRTFVKGKLYGNVKNAKPYIKMLQANSTRVKASVGGLQPQVIHNTDGTEKVTSFRWDDMALTCSPVNYTVAPAVFAKSMTNLEFCKSLQATMNTTNASELTGGAAIIGEDLANIIPEVEPKEDIEKSNLDCILCDFETLKRELQEVASDVDELNDIASVIYDYIENGEFKTVKDIEDYLVLNGIDQDNAQVIAIKILKQGENEIMAKSNFKNNISLLLKSLKDGKKKNDIELDDEDIDYDPAEDIDLDEDDIEDGPIQKSLFDEDEEDEDEDLDEEDESIEKSRYTDATEVLEGLHKSLMDNKSRVRETEDRLDVIEKSIQELGKVIIEIANRPIGTKSIVSKSQLKNDSPRSNSFVAPSAEDYDVFSDALIDAKKHGRITLQKSVHLDSVFQKAMHGVKMNSVDDMEIRKIYKDYTGE